MKSLLSIALYLHYVVICNNGEEISLKPSIENMTLPVTQSRPVDKSINTTSNNTNKIRPNCSTSHRVGIEIFPSSNGTSADNTNTTLIFTAPPFLDDSDPCVFKLINLTVHKLLLNMGKFEVKQGMNHTMENYFSLKNQINKSISALLHSPVELMEATLEKYYTENLLNLVNSSMELQKLILIASEPIQSAKNKKCNHSTFIVTIVILSLLIVGYAVFKICKKEYYSLPVGDGQRQTLIEDGFYNT